MSAGRRRAALAGSVASTLLLVLASCNLSGEETVLSSVPGRGGGFGTSPGGGVLLDAGGVERPEPCGRAIADGPCSANDPVHCEIGEHPALRCNQLLRCTASRWHVEEPTGERASRDGGAPDAATDGSPEAAASPRPGCDAECPASLVLDRPDGCQSESSRRLLCEYPDEGYTCGCRGGRDDAGAFTYTWTCGRPAAGCPRSRPRIGEACVRPMRCDYGGCTFAHGLSVRCYSERWDLDPSSCVSF